MSKKQEKTFELKIITVRVGLGEDIFVGSQEAEGLVLIKNKNIESLCSSLKKRISDANGDLVEVYDGKITWTTPDLTIFAEVYNEDSTELTPNEIQMIDKLMDSN